MKNNIKLNIYIYFLIILYIIFALTVLNKYGLRIEFDFAMIVLFGVAIYSERMDTIAADANFSLSFSCPISMFSGLYFPPAFTFIMIISYTLANKIFTVGKFSKEVFDKKLIFNISQFSILSSLLYLVKPLLLSDIGTIEFMLIVSFLVFIHICLNALFVALVIYFYSGEFIFFSQEINIKSFTSYVYFTILLMLTLIAVYSSFQTLGMILVFLIFFPIKKNLESVKELYNLSIKLTTDSRTNAFNFTYFKGKIEELITLRKDFGIIFLDMDGFKDINDNYGHQVGDLILIEFVKKMKNIVDNTEGDICRFAGDEFGIIIYDTSKTSDIFNKIDLRRDNNSINYNGQDIQYRYSMGFYNHKCSEELAYEEIIEKVDSIMYKDKKNRKNKVL